MIYKIVFDSETFYKVLVGSDSISRQLFSLASSRVVDVFLSEFTISKLIVGLRGTQSAELIGHFVVGTSYIHVEKPPKEVVKSYRDKGLSKEASVCYAMAKLVDADYLVTEDAELLEFKSGLRPVRVMTPVETAALILSLLRDK